MPKAKSRLANSDSVAVADFLAVEEKKPNSQPATRKLVTHWQFLPTLFFGILFALALSLLIFKFSPEQIKNWLIPNAYLPFFVCLFGTNFFLFSFFFLDSAIGLWWAVLLCSFVFLKVQAVVFSGPMILVFMLGAGLGLVLKFRQKLFHH